MGFGFLFYGFLMMIEIVVRTVSGSAVGIDIFPDLAGYLLMLAAACRLDGYAKGFGAFRKCLYPLIALGTVSFGIGIFSATGLYTAYLEIAVDAIKMLSLILQGVAFFYLFAGIVSLANEVELPGIAQRARFACAVGSVYYAFSLLLTLCYTLPLGISAATLAPFMTVSVMLFLVYVILSEVVFFNCYRYICYEGEEYFNPSDIESPIAKFLNKLFGKNKD